MRICVVYPNACKESALYLAEAIGADAVNPYKSNRTDFTQYDVVFNYGVGHRLYANKVINHPRAVGDCVNKLYTFNTLKLCKLAHPAYWKNKQDVPKDIDIVVCRDKVDGRAAEGMTFCHQHLDEKLPNAELYTEWFDTMFEYRIVVFMGKVVGRYHKAAKEDNTWEFVLCVKKGFEVIDDECLKAAKALNIDYVGFDVVENEHGQFVILEANSGPIITDESVTVIKKYFKTL